MPNTRSAKKALRQSLKRKKLNLQRKEAMKKAIKDIKKQGLKLMPLAYKAIDKAAKEGVIKKNTASRKKSRLMKSILGDEK